MRNDGVHDVVGESLAGEVACGLRACPTTFDDAPGPLRLALQRPDHLFGNLGLNPGESELVPDSLVPRSALGQRGCPRFGVPAIVDERRANELLDHLQAFALPHAAAREEPVDLARRAIAVTQSSQRLLECSVD